MMFGSFEEGEAMVNASSPVRWRGKVSALLALSMIAASCGTNGLGGNGQSGSEVCNVALITATAALTCGLVSNTKKRSDRVAIAAACGAAGLLACYLANSYSAKKTKDEQTVLAEYQARNAKAALPQNATLTSFSTSVTPNARVTRGNEIDFNSSIAVIPGQREKDVKVEQEVSIVDADGEVWGKPTRKLANPAGGGGEFATQFKVPISKSMEEGRYRLNQTVFINGRKARDSVENFQVLASYARDQPPLALLTR